MYCSRSEPETGRIWWAEAQVVSHNELDMRNLESAVQELSWLPGVLVPKVRIHLPAKEVKPHSSENTFSHLCCLGFQGLPCNTPSRNSCGGGMVDLLQLVYFNFPIVSLLYVASPPLFHPQFLQIPSWISSRHIKQKSLENWLLHGCSKGHSLVETILVWWNGNLKSVPRT